MLRNLSLAFLSLVFAAQTASAGDLVRVVRYKISANDLYTGAAAVEDYKREKGVDAEYLDAVGWLARGAQMQGKTKLAQQYVAELHREIPKETPELVVPFGAAIEVESKLLGSRDASLRYLRNALAHAEAPALRSRIEKNINLLTIEGKPAPAIGTHLTALKGKPVVLFFFAAGCGDCKAQAPSLMRVWEKYKTKGVAMLAVTRNYGTVDDKPATPEEEKARVDKVWGEIYPSLSDVPVVVDTDAMIRYGGSATPTFALLDRKGIVRFYTPTRLSEAELSRRLDELLAD